MTRFFSEADVLANITMADAMDAVKDAFIRVSRGRVRQRPRVQFGTENGFLAALFGVDDDLELAIVKTYAVLDNHLDALLVAMTSTRTGSSIGVVEGDLLTRIRTGAASGVAAGLLARAGAASVGIIGCGRQAPYQLEGVRRSCPGLVEARAWCRSKTRLQEFCDTYDVLPADCAEEVLTSDIVLAATTSSTPVVRGAALKPGALVIAIGGDQHGDRELDDDTIERAALVTCDSIETSKREAADLWQPVFAGIIGWDEVVALDSIVSGQHQGRSEDDEIVVFKSNGLAAWDLAVVHLLVESTLKSS